MNTETKTTADQAIDNVVAILMGMQRDRIITKVADEFGITKGQADRVARSMGR